MDMTAIRTCPSCGSENIKKVRRKWTGEHRGQKYSIEKLDFFECPECGERVYSPEAMRRIEHASPAFTGKASAC